MAELYTLGNITVDDIVFHDGRVWMDRAGGNAIYSALGAQIWMDHVGLIARIGNDLSENTYRSLVTTDLELVLVPISLPNIHVWGLYEPDGNRRWISHIKS